MDFYEILTVNSMMKNKNWTILYIISQYKYTFL